VTDRVDLPTTEEAPDLSQFSFEIDPHRVLGVGPQATLAEIQVAYRQKAKKYHPDAGGEDWVFRILVQAYEMLSSARIVRATETVHPAHPAPKAHVRPQRGAESIHSGIHDKQVRPSHVVAVEHFCVRYLWDEVDYLWLTQGMPDEERFLSCNLILTWPDPTWAQSDGTGFDRSATLVLLHNVFDQLIINTRAISSRARVDDDRFTGWISYSNFDRSWKSVNTLHQFLLGHGLGLRQWSRDLYIPRAWGATH
jgi:DnaJ domain